jgi:hypothetical protein
MTMQVFISDLRDFIATSDSIHAGSSPDDIVNSYVELHAEHVLEVLDFENWMTHANANETFADIDWLEQYGDDLDLQRLGVPEELGLSDVYFTISDSFSLIAIVDNAPTEQDTHRWVDEYILTGDVIVMGCQYPEARVLKVVDPIYYAEFVSESAHLAGLDITL